MQQRPELQAHLGCATVLSDSVVDYLPVCIQFLSSNIWDTRHRYSLPVV